jgi:hypothetical protein
MLVTVTKETGRRSNGRRRAAEARGTEPRPEELPPITSVFLTDGRLHHAWCKQPLDYQGTRAGLELDFYCYRCVEHVTLPESVLARIPSYSSF